MMINKIRSHKLYPIFLLALLLALLTIGVAYAAGNVDATNKWAYGTNIGWLNFAPAHGGGVMVYENHLEGYVWAENVGWIRLNSNDTTGGTPYYANTTKDNYGVNFDNTTGQLSGYAWGTNIGWINFNPTDGGVMINTTTGDFSGYAWGENIGWISFSGTAQDATPYKVTTTSPTVVTLSNFAARVGNNLAYLVAIPLIFVVGSLFYFKKRVKHRT
jgi:hypothetical protein